MHMNEPTGLGDSTRATTMARTAAAAAAAAALCALVAASTSDVAAASGKTRGGDDGPVCILGKDGAHHLAPDAIPDTMWARAVATKASGALYLRGAAWSGVCGGPPRLPSTAELEPLDPGTLLWRAALRHQSVPGAPRPLRRPLGIVGRRAFSDRHRRSCVAARPPALTNVTAGRDGAGVL